MATVRKSKKVEKAEAAAAIAAHLEIGQEAATLNLKFVPNKDNLLELRTLAGQAFKNLLDTLKAVLNEANLVFTKDGLKLLAIDSKKIALVHLFIEASSFEYYHCENKVLLGVDIDLLQKIIKCNKQNDLMCFVVTSANMNQLEISFENFQSGTRTSDTITLLTLPEFSVKDYLKYQGAPAEMSSQLFQHICREMATFQSSIVEIISTYDSLIFRNLDGISKRIVSVKIQNDPSAPNPSMYQQIDNNTLKEMSGTNSILCKGVFHLKFLKSFAKAANLSPRVRIYLGNDQPITCEYSISGLGTLKYCLGSEP